MGKKWHHTGSKAEPTSVTAFLDTGADLCIMTRRVWEKLAKGKHRLNNSYTTISGAVPGRELNVIGETTLSIGKVDNTDRADVKVTVVEEAGREFFLSEPAMVQLGLLSKDWANGTAATVKTVNEVKEDKPCSCPTREAAPDPPTWPTSNNSREELEKLLLDHYSSSTFNTCTHQRLPTMKGEPLRVKLKDGAILPKAAHVPAKIPIAYKKRVMEDLERDERLGVIERVPENVGSVSCCARMLIVPKNNGDPRRVVDFKALNDVCERQTHHTPSPFQVASTVPPNKLMTTADAWNGYHSIEVHEQDRHYFTFITEFGRYRYRAVPQGWIASGDAYTYRYDNITRGISRHMKIIDDSILWSDNLMEAFEQAGQFLTTVGRGGVVLNKEKFHFADTTAEFAGFRLGDGGVRPLDSFVEAIRNFPVPSTITDMRSFFALVEQCAYAFPVKKPLDTFRELLKKGSGFYWDDTLTKLFVDCREYIAEAIKNGIKTFDGEKITTVESDWSCDGMGFWVRQKHCDCPELKLNCCRNGWRVALAGSRFCSGAESR